MRKIQIYELLLTINMLNYSGRRDFCSPGTHEFFEVIFSCCLFVKQKIVDMLEKVAVGANSDECWVKWSFVGYLVQFQQSNLRDMRPGLVMEKHFFFVTHQWWTQMLLFLGACSVPCTEPVSTCLLFPSMKYV